MKSNEFRLGNLLIEKKYKMIVKVTDLLDNRIGVTGDFKGRWQVQPIPITEEWLLKFGFNQNSHSDNYIKGKEHLSIKFGEWQDDRGFKSKEWIYSTAQSDAGCCELLNIKFVHQLQNLYFALTEKELEL